MKNFKKWSIALSFLSGFFYFIPFLFPSFFFLSWFALVPLLLAIQGQSYKKVYFLGWICGSLAQTAGIYWMANSKKEWHQSKPTQKKETRKEERNKIKKTA